MPKVVFTERELAEELGLSYWTIRKFRVEKGMPHFRTAKKIFYRLDTVLDWLGKQEEMSQNEIRE
jgi:hypothetical protein